MKEDQEIILHSFLFGHRGGVTYSVPRVPRVRTPRDIVLTGHLWRPSEVFVLVYYRYTLSAGPLDEVPFEG